MMAAAAEKSAAPGGRSICFVAHNALAALTGRNRQHAGGIERQQTTMAIWLAARGWDVSMIVWDDPDDAATEAHGVKIIRLCSLDDGLPVLRFLHPRWTSLNTALAAADADLYYYNCGDLGLGQIVAWARRRGKPVVFSVPSDPGRVASMSNCSHNRCVSASRAACCSRLSWRGLIPSWSAISSWLKYWT